MSNKIDLSWGITQYEVLQGGTESKPYWTDVDEKLEQLREHCGTVSLNTVGLLDNRLCDGVQLRADKGKYFVSFREYVNGDYEVHTLSGYGTGKVEILGDYWDASSVTEDFDLVKSIFHEIHTTGTVARERFE